MAGPRGSEPFLPDANLLERLFLGERRRLGIIADAFAEKPVLKLVFGAMIRAAERRPAIKVTHVECRPMAAVREEPDQEYRATIRTPATPSARSTPPISPAAPGLDRAPAPLRIDCMLRTIAISRVRGSGAVRIVTSVSCLRPRAQCRRTAR